jgi:His/Glu/Gln/Arg/opine family amino acid ABC transporter permease subunit
VPTLAQSRSPLAALRRQSTGPALAIALGGGLSFGLMSVGTLVVLAIHGLVPVERLIRGLTSPQLRSLALGGVALGLLSALAGRISSRRMPTKASREAAIAGAVLGLQAALAGGLILWLTGGDVEALARGYLDFEAVAPQLDAFIRGARNTLVLAASAEAAGVALGLVLAVFAISRRAVVRAPARAYINFFRGVPLLWLITFIGLGVPMGLRINIGAYTAAIIALSLNAAAYAAEIFRAGIQSIERGQLEAARGLGMSYLQAMRYAIVPQAFRRVIPPLMNELVILIKDTSLVLFLGLTFGQRDLMSVGQQGVANTFNATFLVATAIGYLVISLPLIRLVNALERRLRSGLVGVAA